MMSDLEQVALPSVAIDTVVISNDGSHTKSDERACLCALLDIRFCEFSNQRANQRTYCGTSKSTDYCSCKRLIAFVCLGAWLVVFLTNLK